MLGKLGKIVHKGKHGEVEEERDKEERGKDVPVTGPMLQKKVLHWVTISQYF